MAKDKFSGPLDFAPLTQIMKMHLGGAPLRVTGLENILENVNGFWVAVCQDVLFSSETLAENPIDCRIFFADNARRKTESGIGGKNP
jgi:hypothetical protein